MPSQVNVDSSFQSIELTNKTNHNYNATYSTISPVYIKHFGNDMSEVSLYTIFLGICKQVESPLLH